jgi:hypothetical protein
MEKGVLPPATASCVKSYPTVVKQGLIWVWMHPGVSPNPDEISTFDPIDQPGVIHMDFQRYCISLIMCSSCSVCYFVSTVCLICCVAYVFFYTEFASWQ